ncbi:MAG: MBL fold metallo-hydrolase [Chloroflexota bacterium]
MKVTFLGTSAAWPSARHNNVAFVAHGAEPVLFECGPSILYQLAVAGIDPRTLRTVIISHIHGDHSLGLPMLLISAEIAQRRAPLTVCLPESAVPQARQVCLTVYPSLARLIDTTIQWVALPERESAATDLPGRLLLRTVPADHPVPVVSSRVEFADEAVSIGFSGDTAPCERVGHNAAGVDLLAHESNWSVALKTPTGHGHSTAADAGRIAALAGAKRLALVHRSRELDGHNDEVAAEARECFPGHVLVPDDNTTIEI